MQISAIFKLPRKRAHLIELKLFWKNFNFDKINFIIFARQFFIRKTANDALIAIFTLIIERRDCGKSFCLFLLFEK